MKHTFIALTLILALTPISTALALPTDPNIEQWGFKDTQAYNAWERNIDASGVVVAVIDNGFDSFHPDLQDNVWNNEDEIPGNGIDDDENGYVDDVYGWDFVGDGDNNPRPSVSNLTALERNTKVFHHGTVVAGIIGARSNNGVGGAGVAPNVKLMNIRLLDQTGNGGFDYLDDAIRYAVDNGADIINLSMVGNGTTANLNRAVNYAYRNNVAIVAAAGNNSIFLNNKNRYPVCHDVGTGAQKVLGVSALAPIHVLAYFSNYGSQCIDLTAPGEGIVGTLRYAPRFGLSDFFGYDWNGTSFAAPFVSGALALVKAVQPDWSVDQLYDAILSSVHKTPPQDEVEYANLFGRGFLQIDNAVAYALKDAPGFAARPSVGGATLLQAVLVNTGLTEQYDIRGDGVQTSENAVLQNAHQILQYTTERGENRYIVTTYEKERSEFVVSEFTERWLSLRSWSIRTDGPYEATLLKSAEAAGHQLALSPTFNSKELFALYNLGGELQSKKMVDSFHQGVASTRKSYAGAADELVVAYTNEGISTVATYALDGSLVDTFTVSAVSTIGSIAAGDIDGDGEAEYAIASAAGSEPWLVFLESEGAQKRKFIAYTLGYQNGFEVAIHDYNGDGLGDIVAIPRTLGQPIRVWTGKKEKIVEWHPFSNQSDGEMRLIGN